MKEVLGFFSGLEKLFSMQLSWQLLTDQASCQKFASRS